MVCGDQKLAQQPASLLAWRPKRTPPTPCPSCFCPPPTKHPKKRQSEVPGQPREAQLLSAVEGEGRSYWNLEISQEQEVGGGEKNNVVIVVGPDLAEGIFFQ